MEIYVCRNKEGKNQEGKKKKIRRKKREKGREKGKNEVKMGKILQLDSIDP